ncbi:MAG: site-specific integrase [Armatimonadota bacterium]|nr:site-specific integrase [Armatimonadota bacterium]
MRGSIIRPRGRRKSWVVRLYVVDPQTGAKRRVWLSFPTRTEAEAQLATMLATLAGGGTIPTTRLTVGQFLEQWLQKRAGTVRETTWASYREIIHAHLIPALGRAPLRALTPLAVQGYVAQKLRHLAPATVRKHLAVLREALGHAVRWGLLTRNVCDLVERPRVPHREIRVWDSEQVRVFLAEARRSSPYYPLYVMAATTGMRAGELLALRWSDVDFLMGTARVERTFYRLGRRQLFQQPKTDRGRRVVTLPATVLATLRDVRTAQEAARRELGEVYVDLDLVFAQPDGKPLHLHLVRRDFRRVARAARLPQIRFHDLRHSHATDLLAHGEHPKVVSERLGHADPAFTLRVYGHLLPGLQAQATARLEERLFPRR